MTGKPRMRTLRGLAIPICLMTLVCLVAPAGCDQFASIAVVDSDADAVHVDDEDIAKDAAASSLEPPDEPSDAEVDTDASLNPPAAGNGDESDGGCVNRPVVAVCDPTREGACADMMQCVIDQSATTPTGACVFSTPLSGDPICFGSFATESCPPTYFCWGGACREPCLCDEDCSTGKCCGERIGDTGFKLCADC